jgi:hypothetical protein
LSSQAFERPTPWLAAHTNKQLSPASGERLLMSLNRSPIAFPSRMKSR